MHNRMLEICRFSNETNTRPNNESYSWSQVVSLHNTHDIRAVKSGPMFGGYRCNGGRENKNVPFRSLIQLDIDTKTTAKKKGAEPVVKVAPPIDEVQKLIADYEWIAASSHGHDPVHGIIKYRIVMPPDRDILPDEYPFILIALNSRLGGVLDQNAFQWSQPFYLPSCPPQNAGNKFFTHNIGSPLPVDRFVQLGRAIARKTQKSGPVSKLGAALAGGLSTRPETLENIERLKSALDALDPDMERNEWRNAVWSVAAHQWASGHDKAREWSARGRLWDEKEFEKVWNSFDPMRSDAIGGGTVYHMARQVCWIDPAITAESDVRNAIEFAADHRGKLFFGYPAGKWLRFDGSRWAWCDAGEEMVAAKATAARIARGAARQYAVEPTHPDTIKAMKDAKKLQSEKSLMAMLNLAKSESGMGIGSMSMLDADPWLLNVGNGVVDLRTGKLLAHSPDFLMVRQCNANYAPGADCPKWKQFLDDIFESDLELIGFVQRALGYSLSGSITEEVFFFMHGSGANGKSVFANVTSRILDGYSLTAPATMLSYRREEDKGRATSEMARLNGSRLVLANETQAGERLDERLIKVLVSRERIAARFMYKELFEFLPTHKLWVRGNHKPVIKGADEGTWRRIHLIPFKRFFKLDERIPDLEDTLMAERDAILTWMIEGCLAWQRDGLRAPDAVVNATAEYRDESDIFGQWLDEFCALGAQLAVAQTDAYGSYKEFCVRDGYKAMSKKQFTTTLKGRGITDTYQNSKRAYLGITLKGKLAANKQMLDELTVRLEDA